MLRCQTSEASPWCCPTTTGLKLPERQQKDHLTEAANGIPISHRFLTQISLRLVVAVGDVFRKLFFEFPKRHQQLHADPECRFGRRYDDRLTNSRSPPAKEPVMALLGVNIDHVATVRQARRTIEPDPVHAAVLAEMGGADGITVHLREDRRHIQDRDVRLLRQMVRVKLNLEMAVAQEIVDFALDVRPDMVTLVPEKREEVTTEGGLDVAGQRSRVSECVDQLQKAGIYVSLFIDPDVRQVEASAELGVEAVELHTGAYADATSEAAADAEFDRIVEAAQFAVSRGLVLNMGHGLTYRNVQRIARIDGVNELNIGHSIISHAVMVGLERAVREMKALI